MHHDGGHGVKDSEKWSRNRVHEPKEREKGNLFIPKGYFSSKTPNGKTVSRQWSRTGAGRVLRCRPVISRDRGITETQVRSWFSNDPTRSLFSDNYDLKLSEDQTQTVRPQVVNPVLMNKKTGSFFRVPTFVSIYSSSCGTSTIV